MKTERGIGRARNARLNRTIAHARALYEMMLAYQGTAYNKAITNADFWDGCREHVAQIAQCFHECNAYNNSMVPDNVPFDREFYEVKGESSVRQAEQRT